MPKQLLYKRAASGRPKALAVAALALFLAFGNAVSAFGKGAASNGSRRAKPAPAKKAPETNAAAETAEVKAPAKKAEPFVVESWGAQQSPPPPQTPPAQTPAQRDATRPPSSGQQQTVPPTARPGGQDPRTPPSTTRPAPTVPPGGTVDPRQPARPGDQTTTPSTTQTPETLPADPAQTDPSRQQVEEPSFPAVEPRPVPPMPSLARVGVVHGDTVTLTLNESIRRALENNNDIEVARGDVRFAEATLHSLEGVFDPVFTFTPEYNNSSRPTTNIFGGADQSGVVSTTQYNNDFSVNRQFGKGGGNYSYFFNNTREKTSATNLTLNPTYSAAQGISFTQPLWRNRSIDRNRQQIRVQRKRLEQTDADFRRRTTDVIAQVQRAYWDLVFALRDEQNQVANLNLARENFRRTEASVAAGAVAPLERAEVQTELSNRESALLVSTQQVTIAENNLKALMLKDPAAPEWSKVLVPTDQPTFDETPVSLETALKEARDNRQELRRLKLQNDISAIDIQFYKNQTKPRIDLTGAFQTNGLAGTRGTMEVPLNPDDENDTRTVTVPIPNCAPNSTGRCIPGNFVGGYGSTLRNLFNLNTRQVVVGVTIQLPWKNKTAEANLAAVQIQRDQLAAQTRSQEQVIEVEVRDAVQAVETARRRVLAARQARASAEEQLAGERRLYQVGRSTTFLLFQRENQLVNARNLELRAETDYNKALAELQRSTSTTLRANNVLIDSPYAPEKFKD
ncbi:MAG TPA: TolC family protein [Pyrinomonadaceae bacterium]|jgi:HAE1 family hydrophobic/amphiphilic exporter-1|nr:TolC family protein [Pyrinomonadaceae bacterium]